MILAGVFTFSFLKYDLVQVITLSLCRELFLCWNLKNPYRYMEWMISGKKKKIILCGLLICSRAV